MSAPARNPRPTGILAGFILLLLLAAVSFAYSAPRFKKEYRMQVNVGPTTYWGMGAAKFAELAEEKTAGRIHIKPYYGSQLLKGAQLNSSQMVAMGAIDLAFESTINTAPVIPDMNLFSLPFFVDTYERLDRLEEGKAGRLLFEAMTQKGLMPLAWGENGFRQLTNSKREIHAPPDLAGLKVRVVGSPIFVDIFRRLGADPINMNWGDAITAFQQHTVDGQENPAQILLAVRIQQYHRFLTRWNYLADPLILYWSRRQWKGFPEDIQSALREAAAEACRYQKALARAGLDGSRSLDILRQEFDFEPEIPDPVAYFKEQGMTVTRLTEDEQTAFRGALRPVFDKWVSKLSPAVYEAALDDIGP